MSDDYPLTYSLAGKVRAALMARHGSRRAAAEAAGVSPSTMSRVCDPSSERWAGLRRVEDLLRDAGVDVLDAEPGADSGK